MNNFKYKCCKEIETDFKLNPETMMYSSKVICPDCSCQVKFLDNEMVQICYRGYYLESDCCGEIYSIVENNKIFYNKLIDYIKFDTSNFQEQISSFIILIDLFHKFGAHQIRST